MESDDLRFRHIGLSSDGAVIFCEMDNRKTYALPLSALKQAEDWDPEATPQAAGIIHDGYAAFVEFDTGVKIDFPSDFVLHVCEPSYTWYKEKGRAASGVGGRIRKFRKLRRLTLDELAAKCGIAKPNLSRLENDKVTPKFETLTTIAAALGIHPALLVSKHAWTWTRHEFGQWKLGLHPSPGSPVAVVHSLEIVDVFLARHPEYADARAKLLKDAVLAPHRPELATHTVDAGKWAGEKAAVAEARDGTPQLRRGHRNKRTETGTGSSARRPIRPRTL
jgi:transcriptional regulator with XRE-family HTH domain